MSVCQILPFILGTLSPDRCMCRVGVGGMFVKEVVPIYSAPNCSKA